MLCLVFLAFILLVAWRRPYSSQLDNVISLSLSVMMLLAILSITISIAVGGNAVLLSIAAFNLLTSCLLLAAKCLWDICMYCVDMRIGRRSGAWKAAQMAGGASAWDIGGKLARELTDVTTPLTIDDPGATWQSRGEQPLLDSSQTASFSSSRASVARAYVQAVYRPQMQALSPRSPRSHDGSARQRWRDERRLALAKECERQVADDSPAGGDVSSTMISSSKLSPRSPRSHDGSARQRWRDERRLALAKECERQVADDSPAGGDVSSTMISSSKLGASHGLDSSLTNLAATSVSPSSFGHSKAARGSNVPASPGTHKYSQASQWAVGAPPTRRRGRSPDFPRASTDYGDPGDSEAFAATHGGTRRSSNVRHLRASPNRRPSRDPSSEEDDWGKARRRRSLSRDRRPSAAPSQPAGIVGSVSPRSLGRQRPTPSSTERVVHELLQQTSSTPRARRPPPVVGPPT
eukprot:TRINITY_DN29739_c0_g1_i2.p1 TRINITY_DN29739_c0_g1~~TRINITY_DN29739_c0_g1_i2.p1  ORF type:complete len:464 (+),score=73.76 TRINITY_DN29739_c0_g1_i2:1002-2393(+)